jgi:hypothetical protein
MYDTPEFVKQAMAQLVPLYQNAGKASSASNFVGPLSAHAATDVSSLRGLQSARRQCRRRSGIAFLCRPRSNQRQLEDPDAPWSGFKYSGVGREFGRYGIETFVELRAVLEWLLLQCVSKSNKGTTHEQACHYLPQ